MNNIADFIDKTDDIIQYLEKFLETKPSKEELKVMITRLSKLYDVLDEMTYLAIKYQTAEMYSFLASNIHAKA